MKFVHLVIAVIIVNLSFADEFEALKPRSSQEFVQGVLKKGNSDNDSDREFAMTALTRMGALNSEILTEDVINLIYRLVNDENINVRGEALLVFHYQEFFFINKFADDRDAFLKMEEALEKQCSTSVYDDKKGNQKSSINDDARSVLVEYYYALLPYRDYIQKEEDYINLTQNNGDTEEELSKLSSSFSFIRSDRYSRVRGERLSIIFRKAKLADLRNVLTNNYDYLYRNDSDLNNLPLSYRVLVANLVVILKSRDDFEIIRNEYSELILRLESEYKELETLGVNIEIMASFLLGRSK